MKILINKLNGNYTKIIKWTGNIHSVDNALGNQNGVGYILSENKQKSLIVHSSSSDYVHNTVYPLGSYLGVYTKIYMPVIFKLSKQKIQINYIEPKPMTSIQFEVLKDDEATNYTAYYYNGSFSTLPKDFAIKHSLKINHKKQLLENTSKLALHTSGKEDNRKVSANKGDYLLVHNDSPVNIVGDKLIKSVTPKQLQTLFAKSNVISGNFTEVD